MAAGVAPTDATLAQHRQGRAPYARHSKKSTRASWGITKSDNVVEKKSLDVRCALGMHQFYIPSMPRRPPANRPDQQGRSHAVYPRRALLLHTAEVDRQRTCVVFFPMLNPGSGPA